MRVTRTAVGALVLLGLTAREGSPGPPSAGALAGWDAYVKATEARIDAELARGQPFLAQDVLVPTRSAETEQLGANARPVFIQRMPETTRDGRRIEAPGAMLHHWLGSILVPGVQVQTVIDFVQDYDHHARVFEDVVESKLLSRQGDRFEAFLKLRRTKVLTVYYSTVHLVDYRTHDASRASSRSVATKIAELDRPGTPNEREKSPAEERGFMWRLNSYWRFLQVPSGVIVECESISLSRDIPLLLQWIVRPFVTAVPRESLERTLTSIRAGAVARRSSTSR